MNHAFGVIFQKTLPNCSSYVFLLKVFQFIFYNIFVIHFELIFIYWSKFDFCLWIISSSVSVVENNILSLLNCLSPLPKIQLTMYICWSISVPTEHIVWSRELHINLWPQSRNAIRVTRQPHDPWAEDAQDPPGRRHTQGLFSTVKRKKERLPGHSAWLWSQQRGHWNLEISFSFSSEKWERLEKGKAKTEDGQ